MANRKPRPFSVATSDEAMADLKERLAKVHPAACALRCLHLHAGESSLTSASFARRWPDQLEGAEWNYGSELKYVKVLSQVLGKSSTLAAGT